MRKMIVITMLLLFAGITNAQASSLAAQLAEDAAASRKAVSDYVNSPKALEDYQNALKAEEDAKNRGKVVDVAVFVGVLVGIIVFIYILKNFFKIYITRGRSGIDMASDALDSVYSIQSNIDLKSANFYAVAEEEYDGGIIDKGLWSQALVKAKGDETLRKVEYMKLRVMQLKRES